MRWTESTLLELVELVELSRPSLEGGGGGASSLLSNQVSTRGRTGLESKRMTQSLALGSLALTTVVRICRVVFLYVTFLWYQPWLSSMYKVNVKSEGQGSGPPAAAEGSECAVSAVASAESSAASIAGGLLNGLSYGNAS